MIMIMIMFHLSISFLTFPISCGIRKNKQRQRNLSKKNGVAHKNNHPLHFTSPRLGGSVHSSLIFPVSFSKMKCN
ncbi:hypothetical protein F4775DRAFT_79908 [Biscogniauxia sp. FL1348]|nr:hypothetical protein F4775DRAFT_79908 [Biscogniauxia sp. FL1348]